MSCTVFKHWRYRAREESGVITGRELRSAEIAQIWTIDRSEVIDNIYRWENGGLALTPEFYDVRGWNPGQVEHGTPSLLECYDRGGWFYGVFDDARLVGVAILESKLIGAKRDMLQLVFLHVDRAYRDQGIGGRLFELAKGKARERGAKRMYISATPSEHTIRFYLGTGCRVSAEPDAELLALEPEDIHLECEL